MLLQVTDPDERIVEDVKKLTAGITSIIMQNIYAASSSFYFTYQVWASDGVLYCALPFVWIGMSMKMQEAIAGINSTEYGMLMGKLGAKFGEFRSAVVRTQIHRYGEDCLP